MSRGYWNVKGDTNKLLKAFKYSWPTEKEAVDKFNSFFAARKNSPEFNMAARLVRALAKDAITFRKALWNAVSMLSAEKGGFVGRFDDVLTNMPLITVSKDPANVRVFVNLPVGQATETDLQEVCWIQYTILESFFVGVCADKANEQAAAAMRWSTMPRAWARLKRYEEMSIGRALSRYTELPKMLTEAQLRDLSVAIGEQLKPMELLYATKPEHYLEMYSAKGVSSCMSSAKGNNETVKWNKVLFPHGHHPCSWFAYHPKIRGVYAMSRNNVIARTYLHKMAKGVECYGRIYGATPQHVSRFTECLERNGYTPLKEQIGELQKQMAADMDIPGLYNKQEDTYYCPLPYFDNIAQLRITCAFDKENKVFKFKVCPKVADGFVVHTGSAVGWLTDKQINAPRCSRQGCQRTVTPSSPRSPDGSHFCHPECAMDCGYVCANRNDTTLVWILKDQAYLDKTSGIWYTSKETLMQCGGAQAIYNMTDEQEEEEEEFTAGGLMLVKDGQTYSYVGAMGLFEELFRQGKIKKLKPFVSKSGLKREQYEFVGELYKIPVSQKIQRTVTFDDSEPLVVNA